MFIVLLTLLRFTSTQAACPNACTKNGVCTGNSTCICENGFTGADCSLRFCAFGKAWADYPSAIDTAHGDAECSNMGLCNRATGVCKCRSGFQGSACQLTRCPGGVETGKDCSGHGICMPMREAAEYDDGFFLRSIGTTYNLWDASKIMGCVCDDGWAEYDCSLRSCPYGDDPLVGSVLDEIQAIDCLCGSGCAGSFRLDFRNELTTA